MPLHTQPQAKAAEIAPGHERRVLGALRGKGCRVLGTLSSAPQSEENLPFGSFEGRQLSEENLALGLLSSTLCLPVAGMCFSKSLVPVDLICGIIGR